MEWYLKVVKENYANFSGRARRKEFWMFYLMYIVIGLVLFIPSLIGAVLESETLLFIGSALMLLYSLAMIVPTIAVIVRRLQDTGKSGWLALLMLIPFGGIILLVLCALEGDIGPNEYGEDPKQNERF